MPKYKSVEHYVHGAAYFAQSMLHANKHPARNMPWSDILAEMPAYVKEAMKSECNPIHLPRKAAQLWYNETPSR